VKEFITLAKTKPGAFPMTMMPDAFEAYLNADIKKWAKVVKLSGAAGK